MIDKGHGPGDDGHHRRHRRDHTGGTARRGRASDRPAGRPVASGSARCPTTDPGSARRTSVPRHRRASSPDTRPPPPPRRCSTAPTGTFSLGSHRSNWHSSLGAIDRALKRLRRRAGRPDLAQIVIQDPVVARSAELLPAHCCTPTTALLLARAHHDLARLNAHPDHPPAPAARGVRFHWRAPVSIHARSARACCGMRSPRRRRRPSSFRVEEPIN